MSRSVASQSVLLLSALGVLVTTAIAIYAAQPWGDNDAYETLPDYLLLVVFIGWAISPYLMLGWSARRGLPAGLPGIMRVAITGLITLWGISVLVNVVFLEPDAQGALIFLFLPIFQWLVIGIFALLMMLIKPANER